MKKTIFLFLILYFISISATAAIDDEGDRWFEVEILIFPQQSSAVEDNEIWPEVALSAEAAQFIVLAPAPENEASEPENRIIMPYQLLANSDLKLTASENKLSRSGQFVPLYHVAWRQPAFPRGSSPPVRIQWSKQMPDSVDIPPSEEALITPPRMPISPDSDAVVDVLDQIQNLEGSIMVSVNRYLHFNVDLFYTPEEPAEKDQNILNIFDVFRMEEAPQIFRMKQTRRMRSGETHYFDHPKFGMIVLVTPYEYKGGLDESEEEQAAAPTL